MSPLSKKELCQQLGRIVGVEVSAETFMRIAWDLGARRAELAMDLPSGLMESPSSTERRDRSIEEWNGIVSRWIPDAKAIAAGELGAATALVERFHDLQEQAYAEISRLARAGKTPPT